jgi:ankyrin repeat protein
MECTQEWRFLPLPDDRAAGAAFSLARLHMLNFPDPSYENACHWLYILANTNHALSQAILTNLAQIFNVDGLIQESRPWLETAACNGSKSAFFQLRQTDLHAYNLCLQHYRTFFWARCYEIPETWVENFSTPTCLDWLCTVVPGELVGPYQNTLLQCAAMTGSQVVVESLLGSERDQESRRALIDRTNAKGDTALILACRSGHASIVRTLLDEGADASICNDIGENGLHWLSSFDEADICEISWALFQRGSALEKPAQVDKSVISSIAAAYFHCLVPGTPLHRAVNARNITAVSALLNLGAASTAEYCRHTPLCQAAKLRRPDILRLLLRYTPESYDVNTLYPNTAGERTITILLRSIAGQNNPTLQHYLSPHPCVGDELLETCRILLDSGAKVIGSGFNPLIECITRHEHAAMRILIKYEPKAVGRAEQHTIESEGDSPLLVAVGAEDETAFDILVNNGASALVSRAFGTTGRLSALQMCFKYWHKNAGIVKRLLELGLDPDVSEDCEASDTALVYALDRGMFEAADLLIHSGASLTKQNPGALRGNVLAELLYNPSSRATLRVLEWLENHPGVSVPFITDNNTGTSAFQSICNHMQSKTKILRESDFKAVFELLRQIFPDVEHLNHQDCDGNTALHYATALAFPMGVEALLNAGADPHIRSFRVHRDRPAFHISWIHAKTPAEIAEEQLFLPLPEAYKLFPIDAEIWLQQWLNVQNIFRNYDAIRRGPSSLGQRHTASRDFG